MDPTQIVMRGVFLSPIFAVLHQKDANERLIFEDIYAYSSIVLTIRACVLVPTLGICAW